MLRYVVLYKDVSLNIPESPRNVSCYFYYPGEEWQYADIGECANKAPSTYNSQPQKI